MKDKIALAAELGSGEELKRCIEILRDLGMSRFETFTPYEVEGLQELLGVPRSRLSWIVLAAALVGGGGAYFLEWWINVVSYPLDIGSRPLHSAPAFLPIMFEMAVLFGSIAALISALVLGGLPTLWHPMFEVEGFRSVTDDGFWLAVHAGDTALDRASATAALEAAGARRVVWLGAP
ncbi:MAG: DUF3341 domain-containing protein [Deltaproteobacteria bacterium]